MIIRVFVIKAQPSPAVYKAQKGPRCFKSRGTATIPESRQAGSGQCRTTWLGHGDAIPSNAYPQQISQHQELGIGFSNSRFLLRELQLEIGDRNCTIQAQSLKTYPVQRLYGCALVTHRPQSAKQRFRKGPRSPGNLGLPTLLCWASGPRRN